VTPYLPTLTRLGFWRVKLGTGRNLDIRCGMTLALIGSSHGETEPIKATYTEAGHNIQTLTLLEIIPAAFWF
jgi:hypothetical protein